MGEFDLNEYDFEPKPNREGFRGKIAKILEGLGGRKSGEVFGASDAFETDLDEAWKSFERGEEGLTGESQNFLGKVAEVVLADDARGYVLRGALELVPLGP